MTRPDASAGLFTRSLGVALLYVLTAKAGLMFAVVGSTVTLVWPPSGIALVAVLVFGYRISWGIALGSFLVNASTDIPLTTAGAIAVGNTLEALAGGWLLYKLGGFHLALARRRDVFALIILAAGMATAISALVGSTALSLSGVVDASAFPSVWLKWWLGDMMGVLVVAPPLLAGFSRVKPGIPPRSALEAGVLLLALAAVGYVIFFAPGTEGRGSFPSALAVFPFVIWGALRFELWGASLVTVVITLLAIWGTALGHGPFAVESAVDSLLRWCSFANVVAVTGLLLAASGSEQRRAQQALVDSHRELEQRVKERTAELARINEGLKQEMAQRKRLEAELSRADENQQRAVGRELHDGLGQHLTSIAFFGASLHQRLDAAGRGEADAARRIVDLINQAIDMVRAVARGLYPAALESGGLAAALNQLAEDTRTLRHIECELEVDPEARIDDPLPAIHLYRIAQEAVGNALRHGLASHIILVLSLVGDRHRLSIRDNGIGFDPDRVAAMGGAGMGLHNLRYRASLLGGSLSIESNPQGGMTVSVDCPAGGHGV